MSVQVLDAVHSLVLGQATEGAVSFDLVHMWHTMGPFAKFIAGVLAVMSVYSLGIMAERLLTYWRAQRASRAFATALRELLPAGQVRGGGRASPRSSSAGTSARCSAWPSRSTARASSRCKTVGPRDVGGFDIIAAVNRAVDRSSLRTVNDLRRGLGALATIGSTAPFVGLLGTVAGIITAFQAMAATGSGGLGAVSAGIAEALITTAFGLLVAIPAVMMFNYLTNRVEDMQVDITDSATELVDFFMKEGRTEK